MPKFFVHGTVIGSKYLGEIEADTKEEAEERAWEELDFGCSLCHQCSSECEDGEVTEIFVEEA